MLKEKTALVTGSTSGIGAGIARALAAQGCNLMIHGLGDPADIERRRGSIAGDFGVEVAFNGADLSEPEEINELLEAAQARFGGIDILVNNAGIQHVSPIEDFPPERWEAIIAINLTAAFHTVRGVLPVMRERGWGRIVNTASVHGLIGAANKSAYVAAKHGIVGLTKAVALEAAEMNITCNAVCPGIVQAPIAERHFAARAAERGISVAAATQEYVDQRQPTRKIVTVDQVAALVVFLCGDGAANITGTAVRIDGGWLVAG